MNRLVRSRIRGRSNPEKQKASESQVTILAKSFDLFNYHHKNLCAVSSEVEVVRLAIALSDWDSNSSSTCRRWRITKPVSNLRGALWTCQIELDVIIWTHQPWTERARPHFSGPQEACTDSQVPKLCRTVFHSRLCVQRACSEMLPIKFLQTPARLYSPTEEVECLEELAWSREAGEGAIEGK